MNSLRLGLMSLQIVAGGVVSATPLPEPCAPAVTFADGRVSKATRHVSVTGDDAKGTGSASRPFRSLGRAVRGLTPGTAVLVHAGTYPGDISVDGARGTADDPIWIMGVPGEPRPVISGGHQGIYLRRPRYVVLERLEIANTGDNGINVDDGGDMATEDAARFLVFRDLVVHDTGRRPSGVPNCLKLAGVNDFFVLSSRFARCGRAPESGAVGVGGVGVHRGVIRANAFEANGYGGVQVKGGSADIDIVGNVFRDTGWRAVNMGGSSDGRFFRPPLAALHPRAEAARIRVSSNVFIGGETAASLTGCVDCAFSGNTVVNPSKWVLRVLQETVAIDAAAFAPAGHGVVASNVFYFRRSDLNTGEDVNVGSNTDTSSISLVENQWYAHDAPGQSEPRLRTFRGRQTGSVTGIRPVFVDESGGDFRVTSPSGPGATVTCGPLPR
jgi:hypothetical protein